MSHHSQRAGSLPDREKRRVALNSALAAVVLTVTKAAVGVMTGSLGILSEAAHSGLDLAAAAATYFAVRVSGRPADHDHSYGHGKVENLSALFETVLLLATCVWIIQEAVQRLLLREHLVQANAWGFLVILLSIVVNIVNSRALMAMARKHRSQALEADALHFSTDVWSSCVVLFGLGCVWLAPRVHLPWLAKADALAALGVALIVVRVSYQLGRRTVDALLDATPPGVREAIAEAARVPGVLAVKNVRVRTSGADLFADVTLSVSTGTGVEQAHDIADRVESSVRAALPGGADVVVHVEPAEGGEEDPEATVRLLAARHGLTVHSLSFCEEEGGRTLELHIEVDGRLSVGEAHAQVEEFEAELRGQLPGLGSITGHIEPRGEASPLEAVDSAESARIARALQEISRELGFASAPHDIRIRQEADGLAVSLHCSLDPRLGIKEAHALTERLEQGLRSRVAEVRRVVIHAEPGD